MVDDTPTVSKQIPKKYMPYVIGGFSVLLILLIFITRSTSQPIALTSHAQSPKSNFSPDFEAKVQSLKNKEIFTSNQNSKATVADLDSVKQSDSDFMQGFINDLNKRSVDSISANEPYSHDAFLNKQRELLYASYSQSDLFVVDYTSVENNSLFDDSSDSAVLSMGSVIDVVVRSQTNNHYVGSTWFGTVLKDVYDRNNHHLLINKGATVIGTIETIVSENPIIEQRIALKVIKIKRNDGHVLDFDENVSDSTGIGAVAGDVDKHRMAKWGGFTAYALLGNGIALSTKTNSEAQSSQDQALAKLTQNFSEASNSVASEYLAIKPTISIKNGDTVSVMIADDINVQPMERL